MKGPLYKISCGYLIIPQIFILSKKGLFGLLRETGNLTCDDITKKLQVDKTTAKVVLDFLVYLGWLNLNGESY